MQQRHMPVLQLLGLPLQVQQYRLQLLDKHGEAQRAKQRAGHASLAADLKAQAAEAEQRRRAAKAAALEASELKYALPVQQDERQGAAARRARAVDFAEDLKVQMARKQVRRFAAGRACFSVPLLRLPQSKARAGCRAANGIGPARHECWRQWSGAFATI